VVLIWHAILVRKPHLGRYLGFFISSTLIYWAVIEMLQWDIPETGLLRIFTPAIVMGTVLLSFAHKAFLGGSLKRVLVAIPTIYAATYLGAEFILNPLDLSGLAKDFINTIGVWQGTYLIVHFWGKKGCQNKGSCTP